MASVCAQVAAAYTGMVALVALFTPAGLLLSAVAMHEEGQPFVEGFCDVFLVATGPSGVDVAPMARSSRSSRYVRAGCEVDTIAPGHKVRARPRRYAI